jgi:hypothetical protein
MDGIHSLNDTMSLGTCCLAGWDLTFAMIYAETGLWVKNSRPGASIHKYPANCAFWRVQNYSNDSHLTYVLLINVWYAKNHLFFVLHPD